MLTGADVCFCCQRVCPRMERFARPLLPMICRLGAFPGGAASNREYFAPRVEFGNRLEEWQIDLGFSPETSGGLLMAVPDGADDAALHRAAARGVELARVGEVTEGPEILFGP